MNLVLFETHEERLTLPRNDRRAVHLLEVLKRQPGDIFDAGVVNGPRGKGTLVRVDAEMILISFSWVKEPDPLDPLTIIVGLPRPQTARTLLRELSSLGIAAIHFVTTDKGEPSYGQSSLWNTGEWRRHVTAGVEQAFCTRMPDVSFGRTLSAALADIDPQPAARIALDNYESPSALSTSGYQNLPVTLAVGSERGWSGQERTLLREHQFLFAHLGTRVLRTETACIAAVSIIKAAQGWFSPCSSSTSLTAHAFLKNATVG